MKLCPIPFKTHKKERNKQTSSNQTNKNHMYQKTGARMAYSKPSFLMLLNYITYFIEYSVAVSSKRTVAFATPQIS